MKKFQPKTTKDAIAYIRKRMSPEKQKAFDKALTKERALAKKKKG